MDLNSFLTASAVLLYLSLLINSSFISINTSGSSGDRTKAVEIAAGKHPQLEAPAAPEDLVDSGSSKLVLGGPTRRSQPDLPLVENVGIFLFFFDIASVSVGN